MNQKVVGITFNPTDNPDIKTGEIVQLIHDKENTFSSRAIAVMFGSQLLGHIGEKNNESHEEVFDNLPIEATISRMARLAEGETFAKFTTGQITSLELEFPMPSDAPEGIQSFNEPEEYVKFIKDAHKYTHNGKQLIGCSTYVKRWIKEFDAEAIAPRYANSLGLRTEDVLGLWNGGGKVSADFGTAIHQALEHYFNYYKQGNIIREKKELDYNKALPSHPVLRQIVEDFINTPLPKHNNLEYLITEALLTNVERGLCGMADRVLVVDEEKKICRVQDYKININCEEIDNRKKYLGQMAELPANKLSEYRIKMSFYARLLELSGWTVSGLDAFVYDGKWKHYPMDTIKLDF